MNHGEHEGGVITVSVMVGLVEIQQGGGYDVLLLLVYYYYYFFDC